MKSIIASVLLLLSVQLHGQVRLGQQAPEISLPDTRDSMVKLSSFKGKVVLIDFWASWCGPCRRSNPAVVKLYNKYKNTGFEVLGVSVDSKKSAWLRAVKQDNINYTQVLEYGGRSNFAYTYGVTQIPTTFLLNKKGTIVGIDLEGKELEDKIVELLR
jgi:peroxiredoxin